jgi:hypothetical protein
MGRRIELAVAADDRTAERAASEYERVGRSGSEIAERTCGTRAGAEGIRWGGRSNVRVPA